jgi:DnaJ-class molecular chaperone
MKTSFRHLALKYHPDRNKNSEESRQKFTMIVEAYEVLSDDQARKEYDSMFNVSDSNAYGKIGPKWNWTAGVEADNFNRYVDTVYTPENIERMYAPGISIDVNDRLDKGLWRATIIIIGSLFGIAAFLALLL